MAAANRFRLSSPTLAACVLFTAAAAYAAEAAVREVQTECPEISNQRVCEFRNGQLFGFGPIMRVYGPDGRFAFNVPIRVPNGENTRASDVAVDSDGTLVMASGGIAITDANGVQTSFIDTKPFIPARVAIASDHSVWVLGGESSGRRGYMILRKYNRDGKLLGSYLPRSTFRDPGLDQGSEGDPGALLAAGGRIVLIKSREVIELGINGDVLGRMRLDRPDFHNFGITSDGNLYSWDETLMPYGGLILLDPINGTSKKLESPGHQYNLIGADGNNLVYQGQGDGPADGVKLVWFNQPGH
jgi:hypothetical protein